MGWPWWGCWVAVGTYLFEIALGTVGRSRVAFLYVGSRD